MIYQSHLNQPNPESDRFDLFPYKNKQFNSFGFFSISLPWLLGQYLPLHLTTFRTLGNPATMKSSDNVRVNEINPQSQLNVYPELCPPP